MEISFTAGELNLNASQFSINNCIRKIVDKMKKNEAKSLIGCCGLYCGLCNKYQSKSPSRCIGCKLGEQHSWCSIWNCAVKKHGFETCAECREIFKCPIFLRRKVADWIPAAENLHQIQKAGLENWLKEQKQRQRLLEDMLRNYNEGRSMSFYCNTCAKMSIDLMIGAIKEAKIQFANENIDESDMRSKAKILKAVIKEIALRNDIHLD